MGIPAMVEKLTTISKKHLGEIVGSTPDQPQGREGVRKTVSPECFFIKVEYVPTLFTTKSIKNYVFKFKRAL